MQKMGKSSFRFGTFLMILFPTIFILLAAYTIVWYLDEYSTPLDHDGTPIFLMTGGISADTISINNKYYKLAQVLGPGFGQPTYYEGGDFLESLCPIGSEITMSVGSVNYNQGAFRGQDTAAVWCNDIFINKAVVDAGWANIYCGNESWSHAKWSMC